MEADALHQQDLADQFEHTGNGKSGGITKVINAMGNVGAVKFRIEAEKYRAEAARLRDELAQIESQNQSTVPAPQRLPNSDGLGRTPDDAVQKSASGKSAVGAQAEDG